MGSGLGLVWRAGLRTGWRGLLGLALLIGLAGGAVLTGLEAARRTDSAFDRLVVASEAWDVLVNPDDGTDSHLEDIAALPAVEEASRVEGVAVTPAHIEALEDLDSSPTALATDGVLGYEMSRPGQIEGRLPDLDDPSEIFLSTAAADAAGLGVGDVYHGRILREADFVDLEAAGRPEATLALYNSPGLGELVDLDVVGVGAFFDEIVVDAEFDSGSLLTTPAFFEAHRQPSAGYWGEVVRLREGADVDSFRSDVEALVPDETIAFQTRASIEAQVDRAVDPQVRALLVFTAAAALAALVLVGQAVSRRLQLDALTHEPLRALGLTRAQRALLGLTSVGVAALLGVTVAVVIAALASPIAPVGVARSAEPDLGLRFDAAVLVLGGLAVFAAVLALSVVAAAWTATGRRSGPGRSVIGGWAASTGLSPPAVAGARFALDPGPSGVPTRSTLVGAVTSVLLVTATLVFAASLDHFIANGRLYGTPWDETVVLEVGEDGDGPAQYAALGTHLTEADEVEAFAVVSPGQVLLDDVSIPAVAFDVTAKPVQPTVLDGRAPVTEAEVALGTATMDDLSVEIGDTVEVERGRRDRAELTVVGRVVLPAAGAYPGADKTTLGDGALMTPEGLGAWSPGFAPSSMVVDLQDGADIDDVLVGFDTTDVIFLLTEPVPLPSDVESLEGVRSTPLLLSSLLVALIAVTVAHALGAAVRARRHDLAVLRTLGFNRRQVLGTVATQATLIGGIGLILGVPFGLMVGRLAWSAIAEALGAQVVLVSPWLGLALLATIVLAIANLVGLVPGLRAARAPTASILRTE